jgi:hypothetical protein
MELKIEKIENHLPNTMDTMVLMDSHIVMEAARLMKMPPAELQNGPPDWIFAKMELPAA